MCGIGGCVLQVGEAPARERLEAMRNELAHRGPDGSGIEIIGNVGLVHTRLAIVDTSEHAHQPMQHPDGGFWISFNGEIFNHHALRNDLGEQRYSSPGDTATLLHALSQWGPAALSRLNGQFAVALLDLGRRRLLLARDRFGIKPLYVARAEDGIWFASEPEALLAAGVAPRLRDDACRSIFDSSCHRGRTTLFAQVERVIPGTCQEVSLDSLEVTAHSWASVAAHVKPATQEQLLTIHRRRLSRLLENTLRSAVHDALLGDVPIGVLCSGGVDSSLVAALALEVKPDMVAFGARYKGAPGLDEGEAQKKVAHWLGMELDLLEMTRSEWRRGLVDAALHFGAPLPNGSPVTITQLADRARKRGIKVLLTGEGADELFAGYRHSWHQPWRDFLPASLQATLVLEHLLLAPPSYTVRAGIDNLTQLAKGPRRAPSRFVSLLKPYAEGESRRTHPANSEIESAYSHHSGARRECETELLAAFDRVLCFLLNRMDKNMMQVSVEARVPYLDPRVVELALNLPLEARMTPWSKGILRDVARSFLPWDIAYRRKIYGMMFDAASWIEEAADPSFLTEGMFRDVFAVPKRDFQNMLEVAGRDERFRLWSAELWCRIVLGNQSQQSVEKELWPQGP